MTRLSRIEMPQPPAFASRPATPLRALPQAAPDVFAPRFGKSKARRTAHFTAKLVASLGLSVVSLMGVTQHNYLTEGKVPTPKEFLVDNFLRSNKGVNIHYMKPAPPYNTTDNLPPSKDDYVETAPTAEHERAERILTNRILELLSGRPDLRNALQNLPRGLEIRIYSTPSIYDMSWEDDGRPEVVKRNCPEGVDKYELTDAELVEQCDYKDPERSKGHVHIDHGLQTATLGITIDYLLEMLNDTDDGYEIVAHEVGGHLIDGFSLNAGKVYLSDTDGMLPGLTKEQQQLFKKARAEMKKNIEDYDSILRSYALKTDGEFLSVVVEAFFERPDDLKEENADMHRLMSDFFRVDPDNLHSANGPGLMTKARANFPPAITSGLIMAGSFVLVFGGHAVFVRIPQRRRTSGDNEAA